MKTEQVIEILNKISQDTGYNFYFENVSIDLTDTNFKIVGLKNNLIYSDNKVGIFAGDRIM